MMDDWNPYAAPAERTLEVPARAPALPSPRLPRAWLIWAAALQTCSTAICLVGWAFRRDDPLSPVAARPVPTRIIESLFWVQLVVSLGAFVLTFVMTRDRGDRTRAWIWILLLLGWTALCRFFGVIATTGTAG